MATSSRPTPAKRLQDRPDLTGPQLSILTGAKSGHAGKLLLQKYAAATGLTGTAQVDAVLLAGADETSGAAWSHYDWDATLNADGTSNRGDCQMCHTATGNSNYLNDSANYNFRNNDFSHLVGWRKASAGVATTSSGQNELLYCWGCHSNASAGVLRRTGDAQLSFQIQQGQPIIIQNVWQLGRLRSLPWRPRQRRCVSAARLAQLPFPGPPCADSRNNVRGADPYCL